MKEIDIDAAAIAKYQDQSWDDHYQKYGMPVTLYDTYDEALQSFKGTLVYISTVNSAHYPLALSSLKRGFNVIIDKPAALSLHETEHLLEIAKKNDLLLAESLVYLEHPQFSHIDRIFERCQDVPKLITAHFSMPPFKEDNFRYKKELGGGALLDTSPYVVSLGRYFFKEAPHTIRSIIHEVQDNGVEIEYSVLMGYSKGRCLIGHFGFNTEYINQITLLGNRTTVMVNRVFTIPEELENPITIFHENKSTVEYSKKGNNFRLYLEKILRAVTSHSYGECYKAIREDAEVRELLRKASDGH